MSDASTRVEARAEARTERLQSWIAALVSTLVHLLFLFLLLLSAWRTPTPPQHAGGGSRVQVDFIGQTREAGQSPPVPPVPPSKATTASERRKPRAPVQSTLVTRADDPMPPDVDDTVTAPPVQPSSEPQPEPPSPAEEVAQQQAQAPAANPPATTQRRPERWGQPPGMLRENATRPGPGRTPGPTAGQASLEVGGYHVFYDLRSEERLRRWRDEGMTELFIPLPGTRQYMVCPLETALRRGSGECRLLDQDAPEMADIGDARKVINVQEVHRRGERVWRGPGAYR